MAPSETTALAGPEKPARENPKQSLDSERPRDVNSRRDFPMILLMLRKSFYRLSVPCTFIVVPPYGLLTIFLRQIQWFVRKWMSYLRSSTD